MMEKLDNQYGADALSEALDVSESGFAAHRGKQDGQRWKEEAELRALIAQSFEQMALGCRSQEGRRNTLAHDVADNHVER